MLALMLLQAPTETTLYTEEACRQSAEAANLHYVRDHEPGISRRRCGKGFSYLRPDGSRIPGRDADMQRIRSLAIPPAYRDVWICTLSNGHLQATGRDERGRKQYRYHPRWQEVRNATKFSQMLAFGAALPLIRTQVEQDLKRPHLSRERILATVVQLMDRCLIRVGNAQYAQENKTYGLTTLRKRHVNVSGKRVVFEFTGKSGKKWKVDIEDRRIAATIRRCEDLPGYELFKYLDENGERRCVDSEDVNAYLQALTGQPFTAKDFRTWSATAFAIDLLAAAPPCSTKKEQTKTLNAIVRRIAGRMGHTPAICRQCYIHPHVIAGFLDGSLREWDTSSKHADAHEKIIHFLKTAEKNLQSSA